MPKFLAWVKVSVRVTVDAKDMYEADEIIRKMDTDDLIAISTHKEHDDLREFPEEI